MLKLDLNLIWVVVNVIVLYILFRKLLWNRLKEVLDTRRSQIDSQYADAKKAKAKARKMKRKYKKHLETAQTEAKQIVADAQARGNAEYNRIVGEAQEQAAKVIRDAQAAAEREKSKAMEDAQAQITELALLAAAKIMGEQSGAATDSHLYDDFLTKANAGEKTE